MSKSTVTYVTKIGPVLQSEQLEINNKNNNAINTNTTSSYITYKFFYACLPHHICVSRLLKLVLQSDSPVVIIALTDSYSESYTLVHRIYNNKRDLVL